MEIDHIVVGAKNLDEGTKYIETLLNSKMSKIGYHDLMGTHNRVLKLGIDCYLEVISVNPMALKINTKRWFELDNIKVINRLNKSPQVIGFVIKKNNKSDYYSPSINLERDIYKWQFFMPQVTLEEKCPGIVINGMIPSQLLWLTKSPLENMIKSNFELYQLEINLLEKHKHYLEYLNNYESNKYIKINYYKNLNKNNYLSSPNINVKLINKINNEIILI